MCVCVCVCASNIYKHNMHIYTSLTFARPPTLLQELFDVSREEGARDLYLFTNDKSLTFSPLISKKALSDRDFNVSSTRTSMCKKWKE